MTPLAVFGALHAGGVLLKTFAGPIGEGLSTVANSFEPNQKPDATLAMMAYRHGLVDEAWLKTMLLGHGITFGGDTTGVYAGYGRGWERISELYGEYPSTDQLIEWYHKGFIGQFGGDAENKLQKALIRAGDDTTFWWRHKDVIRPYLPPDVILAMENRGLLNTNTAELSIRAATGWSDNQILDYNLLRKAIPGPSDLVRFAVREAFNNDLAQELDLDKEYDETGSFAGWMYAQGYQEQFLNIPGMGGIEANWPRQYWRAHWVLPSPGQAYEMLHRLREGRTGRLSVNGVEPPVFDINQLTKLLRFNDYAPKWRLPLAAIAYRPIGLRDVRREYMFDVFDEVELTEKFLDLGYSPDDAGDPTQQMQREKKKKKEDEELKKIEAEFRRFNRAAEDAFRLGVIDRAEYVAALIEHDVIAEAAEVRASAVEIEVNTKTVDAYLKQIRSEFFLGLYSDDEALGLLDQIGIRPEAAPKYVNLWRRRMSNARKIASTETVKRWYRMGIIGQTEALARLRNLGWTNVENVYHVLETTLNIEKDIKAEALRLERDEERRQRKIHQQMKEAQAAARMARVDMEKHSNKDLMKKWILLGEITKDDAKERWDFLYPDGKEDFNLWWEGIFNGQPA